LGACRGKFSLDKLARLAAYRAVDGDSPGAAPDTRVDDIRKLGSVQRYAMPQYVLWYRPGKQKIDV
jgi:hypothetical protein